MRRLASMLLTSFLCLASAWAETGLPPPQQHLPSAHDWAIPLPPARPTEIRSAPATKAAQTAIPDQACARVLANAHVVAASAPAVTGPDGCGIASPVRLEAVVLADGTRIPFEPPALIRCAFAEALVNWFLEDVGPLAQKAGGLSKILGSEGYECRPRNRVTGAKLSEHAKGNAFDLRGLVLRNGQTLVIERQTEASDFMEQLKATACARFTTVLGPGSDSSHETHLHVDLAERHNNYRICEWEVK